VSIGKDLLLTIAKDGLLGKKEVEKQYVQHLLRIIREAAREVQDLYRFELQKDSNGRTPLHYAIIQKDACLEEILVEEEGLLTRTQQPHLCFLSVRDKFGRTASDYRASTQSSLALTAMPSEEKTFSAPLHLASEQPNLLSHEDNSLAPLHSVAVDPWEPDETGCFPLHRMAKDCDMQAIISSQLGLRPDLSVLAEMVDTNNQTPLHLAAQAPQPYYEKAHNVAYFLLNMKAPINAKDNQDNTPFHLACKAGNMRLVQLLIKKQADIHSKNKSAKTGKQLAAEKGHQEIESLLTAIEMSILAPFEPQTLLEEKKQANIPKTRPSDVNLINSLRIAMEDEKWSTDENGKISLHAAAKYGDLKKVMTLVDNCLNTKILIQMKDKKGRTSLHFAVQAPQAKRYEMVEYLLNAGALVSEPDDNGDTAFHIACQKGSVDVISLLHNKQPNIVSRVNNNLLTGRELAEKHKQAGVIVLLDELMGILAENWDGLDDGAGSSLLLEKEEKDNKPFTLLNDKNKNLSFNPVVPLPTMPDSRSPSSMPDDAALLAINFLTAADFKEGKIKLKLDSKGVSFLRKKSFRYQTKLQDNDQSLWITFQPGAGELKDFLNLFDCPTQRQQDAKSYLIHRANNPTEYYHRGCWNFFIWPFAVSRQQRCQAAFNILTDSKISSRIRSKEQVSEDKEEQVIKHFSQIRP
jgi:ankyrin repeat protein